MENNMPKKPGLFARLFGTSKWEEAIQEIESIRAKLDEEKAALDQREAAIKKREDELSKKESEFSKRKSELQKRESKIREQEKKFKRKEKTREKIKQKGLENLEIQTNPQVEVYVGPKVEKLEIVEQPKVEELVVKEEYKEEQAPVTVAVASEPIVEVAPEPEIEEPMVEEKLEIVSEPKEEERWEIVAEPKEEEKIEVVAEPKVEEKLEIVEEPKAEEKLEIVEKQKVEVKPEVQVKEIKTEKKEIQPQKNESKKQKAKIKPQKAAEYSEEFNDKRNGAILEALKELNAKIEYQLKLDDVQAATTSMRNPKADNMVKKRRVATVATIRGYLFGLMAAYLDTLPEEDLKHIEIEGMTSTDFLRFLAADYEFEFKRNESNTESVAISKNENFASNRFIYGAISGYGKITNDVIENKNYAAEVMESAKKYLLGSYLDEALDEVNTRKGIKINSQKFAKRDERLEKEFGDAGQVL